MKEFTFDLQCEVVALIDCSSSARKFYIPTIFGLDFYDQTIRCRILHEFLQFFLHSLVCSCTAYRHLMLLLLSASADTQQIGDVFVGCLPTLKFKLDAAVDVSHEAQITKFTRPFLLLTSFYYKIEV